MFTEHNRDITFVCTCLILIDWNLTHEFDHPSTSSNIPNTYMKRMKHTLRNTEMHVYSYIRNVSSKSKEDLVTSLGRINCVPRIRNAFERLSFALIYVLINDVTRPRPRSFSPQCVHKGSAVILSRV